MFKLFFTIGMSEKDTSSSGNESTRRSILQQSAGIGISALAFSGAAAAQGKSSGKGKGSGSMTRQEKAAEEGKEWDESWVNEDRMDESWIEYHQGSSDQVSTLARRDLDVTIGIKGININISGYLGECAGALEVSALGQTIRYSLDCPTVCRFENIDGGAAYIDYELCVNWDTKTISFEVKGCAWTVTDWECATQTYTI